MLHAKDAHDIIDPQQFVISQVPPSRLPHLLSLMPPLACSLGKNMKWSSDAPAALFPDLSTVCPIRGSVCFFPELQ